MMEKAPLKKALLPIRVLLLPLECVYGSHDKCLKLYNDAISSSGPQIARRFIPYSSNKDVRASKVRRKSAASAGTAVRSTGAEGKVYYRVHWAAWKLYSDGSRTAMESTVVRNGDNDIEQKPAPTKRKKENQIRKPVRDLPLKYECPVCEKRFTHQFKVRDHVAFIHKESRSFSCKVCGVLLRTKISLERHARTHEKTPALVTCQICAKKLAPHSLKGHMTAVHDKVKPFSCAQCDKRFSSKQFLETHLFTHSTFYPFTCGYCGKGFNQKPALVVHERYHTGERPYKCKDCPKAFHAQTNLEAHQRTHTGEKPYVCPTF